MSVLTNPKHELFAQERAKGQSRIKAYELAGFAPDDGNAARLEGRPEIFARIQELTKASAEQVGVTVASLVTEAAEIQRSALDAGQHSAAVAALTAKAKLSGYWVDRQEVKQVSLEDMTDEQLVQMYEAFKRAGLAGILADTVLSRKVKRPADGTAH